MHEKPRGGTQIQLFQLLIFEGTQFLSAAARKEIGKDLPKVPAELFQASTRDNDGVPPPMSLLSDL